jgi:molecular chaperone GrpE
VSRKKKEKQDIEIENMAAEQEESMTVDYGEPETDGAAEETAAPSADQKIAELEEELALAKDRTLRCAAELENYKKRIAREMADERQYALMPLMRDILPVLDNMGRAIETVEQGHDPSHLLEGVKMVNDQLKGVLAKYDCVEIEALNHPFDPHFHEAILQQPNSNVNPNTVLGVTQIGYRLHDRVVRPSNVIVSKLEDREQTTEDSGADAPE